MARIGTEAMRALIYMSEPWDFGEAIRAGKDRLLVRIVHPVQYKERSYHGVLASNRHHQDRALHFPQVGSLMGQGNFWNGMSELCGGVSWAAVARGTKVGKCRGFWLVPRARQAPKRLWRAASLRRWRNGSVCEALTLAIHWTLRRGQG